jgi:hypothetical protein
MQSQSNPLQYEIDQQRRADLLRAAAAQRQLTADVVPPRRLRRAISRALFSVGGALVAGGSALQARTGGLSAHLRRDPEISVPRRRRA